MYEELGYPKCFQRLPRAQRSKRAWRHFTDSETFKAQQKKQSLELNSTADIDLSALTASAGSHSVEGLAPLVGQAFDAATFVASGAHTNYTELTADNTDRNAIQWITDWL